MAQSVATNDVEVEGQEGKFITKNKKSSFRFLSFKSQANSNKRRIVNLFNKYDVNENGYLDLAELQLMIQDRQCTDLPPRLAKAILSKHDVNGDGRLSFDEFYELSEKDPWFVKYYSEKFCKFLIPPRSRNAGAYESEMVFWPPPLMMITITIIQTGFYFWNLQNSNINKLFKYDHRKRSEIWRFVTYMFVHGSGNHITSNALFQLSFGFLLEVVHCWWRILTIYLCGVLSGSIFFSIFSPAMNLVGASGGVYALITAHIATIIMNWREMETAVYQILFFCFYIFIDVFHSFYYSENNVSYVAHFGGGLAGLLVGIGVLRNLKVETYERKLWWAAVSHFAFLILIGILYNIFIM